MGVPEEARGEKRERKEEKTVSVVLLLLNSPKQIQRGPEKKKEARDWLVEWFTLLRA